LSRARMDVVGRILDVARRNAVNAVLCVGDIFDNPDPSPDFWEGLARTFQARAGPHPPVFLIPGNHDPLTPEGAGVGETAAGLARRARLFVADGTIGHR
jgi:DNA repair exonuclease SbcCD nuclease subunit